MHFCHRALFSSQLHRAEQLSVQSWRVQSHFCTYDKTEQPAFNYEHEKRTRCLLGFGKLYLKVYAFLSTNALTPFVQKNTKKKNRILKIIDFKYFVKQSDNNREFQTHQHLVCPKLQKDVLATNDILLEWHLTDSLMKCSLLFKLQLCQINLNSNWDPNSILLIKVLY